MHRELAVEFTHSKKVIDFLVKNFNFTEDDEVFELSQWYEEPMNKEFPPDGKYFDQLKVGDFVVPKHNEFLEAVIPRVIDSGGLDCDDFWDTTFRISGIDGYKYQREVLIRWGITHTKINQFGTITDIKNTMYLSEEEKLLTLIKVRIGMDGE